MRAKRKTGEMAVIVILFIMSVRTYAINITFDYSGTIGPGDEYGNVTIQDTPPDHTIVDMTGGLVDSIGAFDESILNISGGDVSTINAYESSNVNVFGGNTDSLGVWGTGAVNVWGSAYVDVLDTRESGISTISGGTVDRAGVLGFGTINLSGGLVSRALWAGDSGVINVYGYELNKIDIGGGYDYGFAHGKWQDGTNFNIDFGSAETFSHVVLVPEPTTCLLLGIGGFLLKEIKKIKPC